MASSKTIIFGFGAVRNLNGEAKPRGLVGLPVNVDGDGNGTIKPKRFATKDGILVDENGTGFPKVRLQARLLLLCCWLSHCESMKKKRCLGENCQSRETGDGVI